MSKKEPFITWAKAIEWAGSEDALARRMCVDLTTLARLQAHAFSDAPKSKPIIMAMIRPKRPYTILPPHWVAIVDACGTLAQFEKRTGIWRQQLYAYVRHTGILPPHKILRVEELAFELGIPSPF